ncbi:MAG: hypothetical protein P4L55_04455 [Syntrophobacteraceae bacterium]|nr:hypothetical protein [Syntrophobacteraceae bacterium]
MNAYKRMKHLLSLLLLAGALTLCLGALCPASVGAQSTAPKVSFVPASVLALPGLHCKIYPTGSDPSSGLEVYTDDDGYARFLALRAGKGNEVQQLTLACTDSSGKAYSYSVDLTSEETFASRQINIATERGKDRPALKGDPLGYTKSQLIQAGYGLRPDPVTEPAAYARWLSAASKQGRMLAAKRPEGHSHGVYYTEAPWWVGSALVGQPQYVATEALFNVPKAIPGGDGTSATEIALWNGLGGFGTGSGLIQGGVGLRTTPTVATYYSWREYCCGNPDSNGYGGAFIPNPGDTIYSEEWYCDSKGNVSINGGYGCTFLEDLNTGAILNCTQSNGSPCWSVKALPLCTNSPTTPNCETRGKAAEFIIEDQTPQVTTSSVAFTDFSPAVTMWGSAFSAATGLFSQTISTDSNVNVLKDFTDSSTHITVAIGSGDQTIFSTSPSAGASAPAIAVRSTGEADVVIMGPDNSLLYYWATPGSNWSSVQIAGSGTTFSAPAIAVRSTGEADVVARGPNNSLRYYSNMPGKAWSSFQVAGSGTTFSAPAIAVRSTGEVDVVARGPNNSLIYYWGASGATWSSIQIAGSGTTFSAPAIVVRAQDPAGEADVVAMGANNSLRYYYNMPAAPWYVNTIAGSGTTFSTPAIAVRSTGEADVVAMGPNNSLTYYWASPGTKWSSIQVAGSGTTFSAPAIVVRAQNPTGEADVVAMGANNSLKYYFNMPGKAWSLNTIAGSSSTYFAPALAVRSTGEADVVVVGGTALNYFWATPGSVWTEDRIAGLR